MKNLIKSVFRAVFLIQEIMYFFIYRIHDEPSVNYCKANLIVCDNKIAFNIQNGSVVFCIKQGGAFLRPPQTVDNHPLFGGGCLFSV